MAGCSTCQHIKDFTQHTPRLLQPLSIPSHHFESWSLDLITFLPICPCLMLLMLSLPVWTALLSCVGSPLVSWVAPSLVWGRQFAVFSILPSKTMACLCWWYTTEILGLQMHFGRPFGLTWEPSASLVPAIIHRQMAKPSAPTAVSNRY